MSNEKHLKKIFEKSRKHSPKLNFNETVITQLKRQALYQKKKKTYIKIGFISLVTFLILSIFLFTNFINFESSEVYNTKTVSIIFPVCILLILLFQLQISLKSKITEL